MEASGRILFTLLLWELSWKKFINNPVFGKFKLKKDPAAAVVDAMPAGCGGSHF